MLCFSTCSSQKLIGKFSLFLDGSSLFWTVSPKDNYGVLKKSASAFLDQIWEGKTAECNKETFLEISWNAENNKKCGSLLNREGKITSFFSLL